MSSEGSGSDTVRLLMDSGAQTETGTEGGAGLVTNSTLFC